MSNSGMQSFKEILAKKKKIKPPAYPWQDLALRVIADIGFPSHKRNSVFLACKKYSKNSIERALIDTKELCQSGEKWKYFFKVLEKNQKK